MEKQITLDLINGFSKAYNNNSINRVIENAITENGLEKSNNVYENIINLQNTDWEYIHKEDILQYCVNEGGHWQWFVSIVNKYGLMPYEYMPDVFESLKVQNITGLFTDKVKKDCIKLINAKKENTTIDELRKIKETYLQENYTLLSKILGEPKMKFDYEYKDKESNYVKYENITPLEFKDKFLSINLSLIIIYTYTKCVGKPM